MTVWCNRANCGWTYNAHRGCVLSDCINYKTEGLTFKMSEPVKMAPAPVWFSDGKISLMTIYADHYDRMRSVIAAARSGDKILIKFALENYDAKGSRPENAA